jgi:hypothetical protein
MIAAGVSYDTRGFGGGVQAPGPPAPAYFRSELQLPDAGMQWDMYGYGGACMQESGLDSSAAMQQRLGGANSVATMPAQQHRSGHGPSSAIAKRRCGRPKAPNPLEDPSISEKRARRYAMIRI